MKFIVVICLICSIVFSAWALYKCDPTDVSGTIDVILKLFGTELLYLVVKKIIGNDSVSSTITTIVGAKAPEPEKDKDTIVNEMEGMDD